MPTCSMGSETTSLKLRPSTCSSTRTSSELAGSIQAP
eukprot:CAMPEP_0176311704 /NCGR_PEP_ID=MMETSP0121_2-20121125/66285_1 /TAXON_ID=160619 /ORGANISM="Kryptoperidinium foliaceum, Strain CCMP 1326" /LENGTH=36 /DNA_ID= /DNA_START= /DNA_END= /DNA_ORIENTATION=